MRFKPNQILLTCSASQEHRMKVGSVARIDEILKAAVDFTIGQLVKRFRQEIDFNLICGAADNGIYFAAEDFAADQFEAHHSEAVAGVDVTDETSAVWRSAGAWAKGLEFCSDSDQSVDRALHWRALRELPFERPRALTIMVESNGPEFLDSNQTFTRRPI